MKLVSCIRGEVWDVAVDVRVNSPTFLQWHAENLSAENGRALLIPEGFAHGFQALTDDVELLYFHSASHNAEAEFGLYHADPRLSIRWPLAISELSGRDAKHPLITDEFKGVLI
jgi:dTDP-4-dehydrorhamnose 3,5-epimerase